MGWSHSSKTQDRFYCNNIPYQYYDYVKLVSVKKSPANMVEQ